jgi:hypothetical protein
MHARGPGRGHIRRETNRRHSGTAPGRSQVCVDRDRHGDTHSSSSCRDSMDMAATLRNVVTLRPRGHNDVGTRFKFRARVTVLKSSLTLSQGVSVVESTFKFKFRVRLGVGDILTG